MIIIKIEVSTDAFELFIRIDNTMESAVKATSNRVPPKNVIKIAAMPIPEPIPSAARYGTAVT